MSGSGTFLTYAGTLACALAIGHIMQRTQVMPGQPAEPAAAVAAVPAQKAVVTVTSEPAQIGAVTTTPKQDDPLQPANASASEAPDTQAGAPADAVAPVAPTDIPIDETLSPAVPVGPPAPSPDPVT